MILEDLLEPWTPQTMFTSPQKAFEVNSESDLVSLSDHFWHTHTAGKLARYKYMRTSHGEAGELALKTYAKALNNARN